MSQEAPIIWSKRIRFLHWGLATCVAINFINDGDSIKLLHKIVGFTAVAFVFTRVGFGLMTRLSPGHHHLFRYWPLGPRSMVQFFKAELSSSPKNYEGHNPAAAWTYIAIWIIILALGTTGFMMGLDAYWGEEWLEDLHGALSNVLLGLLVVHVIGIFKDSVRLKRKTWMRMIDGR